MFKKSKRRIVAAIMSVLALLYAGTLGVIYSSSYHEMSLRNQKMLEDYVRMYPPDRKNSEFKPPEGRRAQEKPAPAPETPPFAPSPAFRLSVFYSVELSRDGEILKINNSEAEVYDSEELERAALEIMQSGREKGKRRNLIYQRANKDGYCLVAFMDNTIMQEGMTTLFRYTLIFGGVVMVLLFFLAVYLAGRIIRPLEESYTKQKQFISNAGHELKTPVAIVGTNAELLSREIGENQWLSNIQYENERMGRLVGQLLELARTEAVQLQMEKLDFSRLAAGEALPFESVAFENGLVLNCEVDSGLYVSGNSTQLKQLVSILLDNAVRHGEGGEITLRAAKEHGHVRLSVINCGAPIPQEQRKRLFERFYRMDSARTGGEGHYGLGLAIAYSIVRAHKGKIEVLCYDGKVEFSVQLSLCKNNEKI